MQRWFMEINLEKLRNIVNLIFDHISSDAGVDKVLLDKDFYWDIDDEKLYDMSSQPDSLDVGQLYDDWGFLKNIKCKEEAVALMFIHVAPLLRHIGLKAGRNN